MVNLKAILEKAPEGATHYTDGTPSLNVYVKVVHLDGCYLHLAGKWERYPSYAGLKCLEDLRVMLESQAERDALAATVEALREMANRANVHLTKGYAGQSFSAIDCNLALSALAEIDNFTPRQHLAERDAQKGRDGFIAGADWYHFNKRGLVYTGESANYAANQYADSIRREKK